ncbi:LolA family protein [Aquimarina sediminis]|uniref:LolA family protein n=1 Tax=Aquimarina sediminis TaxID=2070536 RepID=UPI000CA070CA|nr:outer membrane lipoprotein carrier protein LolA [Aquimarina sediminis]
MRNTTFLFICFMSFLGVFAQSPLDKQEALAFKQAVVKTANTTKTIVSDFVQYKHLNFLNNDIKTVGKLAFKSPNLIKWEYTEPYKYTAIFNENKLFVNDGGDKSNIDVGSSKMFKNFNNLIINSVKGNMFNDEEFVINYYRVDDFYMVRFIPKKENMLSFIASFELTFDKKTADVVKVKMIEPSDDYTLIVFKNKKRNTTVLNEVFHH